MKHYKIEQTVKVPRSVYLACSGGIDSMCILDFLRKGRKDVTLLYFNHNTPHGNEAESFVRDFAEKNGISYHIGSISLERGKSQSLEDYWRQERYNFFDNFTDAPIITAHHLNDCVETWLFGAIHGNPKLIPNRRGNYIRPYLQTSKETILHWTEKNKVEYIQDESNFENDHARNIIRNEMMDSVLKVNPGIEKVIRKKLMNRDLIEMVLKHGI
jgi:tRNA(Ile)-lysidine synthase